MVAIYTDTILVNTQYLFPPYRPTLLCVHKFEKLLLSIYCFIFFSKCMSHKHIKIKSTEITLQPTTLPMRWPAAFIRVINRNRTPINTFIATIISINWKRIANVKPKCRLTLIWFACRARKTPITSIYNNQPILLNTLF